MKDEVNKMRVDFVECRIKKHILDGKRHYLLLEADDVRFNFFDGVVFTKAGTFCLDNVVLEIVRGRKIRRLYKRSISGGMIVLGTNVKAFDWNDFPGENVGFLILSDCEFEKRFIQHILTSRFLHLGVLYNSFVCFDETMEVRDFSSDDDLDVDSPDAHSCSANADADGYCTICGAVIPGGPADLDNTGCDPV